MKTKVVTVATYDGRGLGKLKESFHKFNVDYDVLGMNTEWKGFGTKIILTRDHLPSLLEQGYTHFIFVDAYDTVFLSSVEEIEKKYIQKYYPSHHIVFNAEKAVWPDPEMKEQYPIHDSEWKYLNSGVYIAPIEGWLKLVNAHPLSYGTDDQRYFTKLFLDGWVSIDYDCEMFQSYAFVGEDDYSCTDDRLINLKNKTTPVVIHGNGRTDLERIYKLL